MTEGDATLNMACNGSEELVRLQGYPALVTASLQNLSKHLEQLLDKGDNGFYECSTELLCFMMHVLVYAGVSVPDVLDSLALAENEIAMLLVERNTLQSQMDVAQQRVGYYTCAVICLYC